MQSQPTSGSFASTRAFGYVDGPMAKDDPGLAEGVGKDQGAGALSLMNSHGKVLGETFIKHGTSSTCWTFLDG